MAKLKPLEAMRRALLAALLGAVVAVGLLMLDGANGLGRLSSMRSRVEALERRIEGLDRERSQLVRGVRDLRTSPVAIERIAREKLGMVRPGELVIRLDPPGADASRVSGD